MANAAAIDRLRAIAARLQEREDPEALWFVAALLEYQSGAPYGLSLDDAFGFKLGPGATPWWQTEARGRRDELLRGIAAEYFPGLCDRAAARAILREATRYQATGWRQDRAFKSAPAELIGCLRADLFALLKTGAPLSYGTIRRALAHETPLSVSQEACDPSAPKETDPICEPR